jgi:RNA polymerase sigma-70 factor (ECF subfamily)
VEAKNVISSDEYKKNKYSYITEGIKCGDADCIIEWIDINKNRLYKIGWAYLRNHADVEDVFHNTIIKVMENIIKLKNIDAFETWFISIFINECRKMLRDKKRMLPTENIEFTDSYKSPDDSRRTEIITGLGNIDEESREVIILKYYSGYSQNEISEILKMPVGTVKTKIFRGIRALRKMLGEEGLK